MPYLLLKPNKNIETKVFSSRTADGFKLLCQGIDNLISESISLTIGDAMEQLAERLINPDAPRNYAELNGNTCINSWCCVYARGIWSDSYQ